MSNILTIARLTFQEAWRRWVVLIGLVLSALFLLMYAYGFALILGQAQQNPLPAALRPQAYNFLLLAGLYVVHGLTVMLAIFASVDGISGEITSHTIQSIVTKPVARWELVLGKWVGFAGLILLYVGVLSGGVLLITYWQVGYMPPNPLAAMGLLGLEGLVLLSVSLLIGTRLATLPTGVSLFMFYGVTFIGTWVEQVAALLNASTAQRLGNTISLLLPVEVLWRLAAALLQPPGGILNNFVSPFAAIVPPAPTVALYAAVYGAIALGLAVVSFNRRDL